MVKNEIVCTFTKSKLILILLSILYFIGLTWSIFYSGIWASTDVFDYAYSACPFVLIIMVPIEIIFASISVIIYCCCTNKVAFKVFAWITAVISIGPIVTHGVSLSDTNPTRCANIYISAQKYHKTEIVQGCFDANSNNAALLSFYTLTHVLLLIHLIMINFGIPPPEPVSTQPMSLKNNQVYSQNAPPQPTGYSQFY